MKGFKRFVLLMICGGLMALAALAGQVGYGDDYGRATLHKGHNDASAVNRGLLPDRTLAGLGRTETEKL